MSQAHEPPTWNKGRMMVLMKRALKTATDFFMVKEEEIR